MEADSYIGTSLSRIRNPAIRHRCHQIGTDGSQKIVQRLLDPLRERLAADLGAELLILSVASWMAYVLRFIAPLRRGLEALRSMGRHNDRDRRPDARLPRHGQSHSRHGATLGADLMREDLVHPIARHLDGLLAQDPRAYLAGWLDIG